MSFKQFFTSNCRLIKTNQLFINRCSNSVLEIHIIGYAKKTVFNLPLKPKRPTPPFFQFIHEKKSEVIGEHNLRTKDTFRILSEMWKLFDVNTKEKMTEAYGKELVKYKENMKNYKESLTDEQKNELFRAKYEALEQKTKRKLKKELKELGKPRKPPTAYILFATEHLKYNRDEPVNKYMVTIAKKWKELDSDKKNKYLEEASDEIDKYNDALIKWEKDMIQAGRLDLVRNSSIINSSTDKN
ncbi:High mobility group box domain [Cinara cedri]|uniref:High mobility group box domain n=1 Tax=Cinara cedri TaxID=506608 RepID=A0A5E4MC09_9HEMI|nr:High mobility group box domain [Cinara cedri]